MSAPNLSPSSCPRCGRPAHFRYLNAEEARKMSPLCWGEFETDCPGWHDVVKPSTGRAP